MEKESKFIHPIVTAVGNVVIFPDGETAYLVTKDGLIKLPIKTLES